MTAGTTMTPSIEHAIGSDGRFELHLRSGDVHLRGVEGDVVRVSTMDGGGLGHLAIDRGEGRLVIDATQDADGGEGGPGVGDLALEVEVPFGASVVVDGASSDLVVTALRGDQRFRTRSGDLRLRDVRGDIAADSVSGDIELTADGPTRLELRAVSGDLAIRAGSIGALRATTTSGDIRISGRFDGDGPYAIETVSGDAILAPAGALRVDLRSITGDLSSDVPAQAQDGPGWRSLVVGSDGPTMLVRSTSGDVRLVAAAPTTPGSPVAPPPPSIPAAPPPAADPSDEARLDVLRSLERGDIDIDAARRQLEDLDRA
jgi:hypothetical protein